MRLIQVFVPAGERELVLEALEEAGMDHALCEETGPGEFEAVVSIPVSPAGVEDVLARLRSAGLDEESYAIVLAAETIVSRRADLLRRRFVGTRLSREELRARAADLAPAVSTYFALLVLSTAIATAGLLMDSAATIIGAMVVAPLMGPALTASVGAVVDDAELSARGVTLQVLGLAVAVVTAAVIGAVLRETIVIPPGFDVASVPAIRERTTPDVLSLFLAIGSGAAGAISLARNVGSVLVGVAIAVALVPPAATVGLGIAWGHPLIVVTAGTLVLVNLLSINLVALAVLWGSGYRPEESSDVRRVRSALVSRSAIILASIALLSLVLGGVTYGTYQTSSFEHEVAVELEAMSDDPAFGDARLRERSVRYELVDYYGGRRPVVTVHVERPQGEREPPEFADRVRERLRAATGVDPRVVVELVDTQRSG